MSVTPQSPTAPASWTRERLRELSAQEREALASEIRQTLISVCLGTGGHLGASLGTVELAIALHSVFESPAEPMVWDVGHQAYAHKWLTGRADRFASLRQKDGIAGFLARDESEHDVFGAGHAGTAVGVVSGLAFAEHLLAAQERRSERWSVAVVGDGALTSGLTLEGLNFLAAEKNGANRAPVLVVLNDNQMSISENVGMISERLGEGYGREFFDGWGFDYIGPINGHELEVMIGVLEGIRSHPGKRPVLVHVMTQKGRGYLPAEEQPDKFHGVGGLSGGSKGIAATAVFSKALGEIMEHDPKVVAITAAMPDGTGLASLQNRFEERVIDVGIAEPHAVLVAGAMATQGLKPVVAIYSTFLQRAFDQLIHDTALQKLPVLFAIDRAGLVGADGATHQGAYDIAYLSLIPGMSIDAPRSSVELTEQLKRCLKSGFLKGPAAIRYPRGSLSSGGADWKSPVHVHQLATASKANSTTKTVILIALGHVTERVLQAASMLSKEALAWLTVISVNQAKPIPSEVYDFLKSQSDRIGALVTCEEGTAYGGFGSQLVSSLASMSHELGLKSVAPATVLGIPDRFIMHAQVDEQQEETGLSASKICQSLQHVYDRMIKND